MDRYPYLLFNRSIATENLNTLISRARSNSLEFRPHFKTHQSKKIGRLFRDAGISAITVSSVTMAEYFADDGWDDITVAFPVSTHEIERLNQLTSEITLNILVVDEHTVKEFASKSVNELGVYIELDPGYGRSGVSMDDHDRIQNLKMKIGQSDSLVFKGFYIHAGHTYQSRGVMDIRTTNQPVLNKLAELKAVFPDTICFGDTPSCSVLNEFGPVDQLSPGNFIFYDWMQTKIGSCTPDQIAVAMMCPVVAKYKDRNQLLIHGGAVHFSKEAFTEDKETYFGVVAEQNEAGWGNPLPENKLVKISQEHGTIVCTEEYFRSVQVGDIIPILPIHSCLTADCMGKYVDLAGETYDHLKKNT